MKPKTTILIVLALGSGLAAAFMTNKLIAERGKTPEGEKVMALVVKEGKNIQAWAYITKADDYFEAVEKPADAVPKSYIADIADKDLKEGFRVTRKISAGNYLTRDDLVLKGSMGIETGVPPGKRAVTIRVSVDQLVGGFVLPRSKVDVLWTYKTPAGEPITQTIFQDMDVLAVDTQTNRTAEGQTIAGQMVTIAVKPEEAMQFALATANGELRLTVRPPGDAGIKLRLKPSHLADLGKPVRDAQVDSSTDPMADTATASTTTPQLPVVQPIPALPPVTVTPTMPDQAPVAAAPKPEPKPEPKQAIHWLRIVKGDGSMECHGYVFDKEQNVWLTAANQGVTRTELEKTEPRRTEPAGPAEKKEEPGVDKDGTR